MQVTTPTPHTVMLRLPEVCRRVGLSRTSIYRLLEAKEFPAPVKLGCALTFVEAEVEGFLAERIAARGSRQAAA